MSRYFISAKEAKELTKQNSDNNFQRSEVIKAITQQALLGQSYLIVDLPRVRLDENDLRFFEELGYTVERPQLNNPNNLSGNELLSNSYYTEHLSPIIKW